MRALALLLAVLAVPAKLPKDVTERLNRELNVLLQRADVRDQYGVWGKAIREAGINPG